MVKTSVLRLKEMASLELSMVDDLYETYSLTTPEGSRIFELVLKKAILSYQLRRPPDSGTVVKIMGGDRKFTFVDNFDSYLAGTIIEEDIVQIPLSVAYVKMGNNFVSATSWEYVAPDFYAQSDAELFVRYFHPFKLKISRGNDGEFTEDSYIYYLNPEDKDFQDMLTWLILKVVRNTRSAINMGSVELFPYLDTLINEYQQQISQSEDSDLKLYLLWRK